MTPRIVAETSLTAAEDAAIREGLCVCFPADREVFSRPRAWHGSLAAWSVLVDPEGPVIAHAGVVEREILVGARRVRAAGIQNVYVVPERRGKKLFQRIMSAAVDEARRRNLDLGMLFCAPGLVEAYSRLGWRLVTDRKVVRVDENGCFQPIPAKNLTLSYPLRFADFPPGDVHLLGNDW